MASRMHAMLWSYDHDNDVPGAAGEGLGEAYTPGSARGKTGNGCSPCSSKSIYLRSLNLRDSPGSCPEIAPTPFDNSLQT